MLDVLVHLSSTDCLSGQVSEVRILQCEALAAVALRRR